jgi:hypothetical protein
MSTAAGTAYAMQISRAMSAKSSLAWSSFNEAGVKKSGHFLVTASKVGGVCRPLRRLNCAKSSAIVISSSRFCGFDGGRGFTL